MKKWLKKALGGTGRERAEKLVTAGVVHAREGRLDDALRAYQAAAEADETLAVAWLNVGLCRLDLYNRDAKAFDDETRATLLASIVDALEKALTLEPTSFIGWRALAHVRERREQWALAEEAWLCVEEHAPVDGPQRLEAKRAREAIARRAAADRARTAALAALQPDTDDAQRRAALDGLTPFLDEQGLVARGHALAGTLSRRLNDLERARAFLERAAGDDREDVEALRELASVCLEKGDLQRALAASMDAYRANPTDAGLVCNVGVCHLGLGDIDKAREFIELAKQMEPKDPIIQRAVDALAAT